LLARSEVERGVSPDYRKRRLARFRYLMERGGALRTAQMFARMRGLGGKVRNDAGRCGRRKLMNVVGDHAEQKAKRVVMISMVLAGRPQREFLDGR
jgi:hypothetical protein